MMATQTTKSIHRQNSDCVVALEDMPVELGRMRSGELYWINVVDEADSTVLVRQILAAAGHGARMALIGPDDPSVYLDGLPADEGPEDLRCYRLAGGVPKAMRAWPKDLDRRLRPRERTLILCLPADWLFGAGELRPLLADWRRWLQGNGCTLLVLAHGQYPLTYVKELMSLNDVLSGMAKLESHGAGHMYTLAHWRNATSVAGVTELQVEKTGRGFALKGQQSAPALLGSDRHQFYIERAVLEGAPVFMADDWHVFDTSAAVYDRAIQANAATAVFALGSSPDVPALARMLHVLRLQRGPALKLVIREMQRGLRYQDEQLLLACGATLVVPSDTAFPHFLSLLEGVQGQTYRRKLALDPEALIERYLSVHARGVVDVERFLAYLEPTLDGPDVAPNGVLVVMKPVPGVAAALAMDQLRLRRLGDLACELDGMVYLFLQGCHPHMVEVALENVFHLPYREIFSHHAVHTTAAQIQHEYLKLQAAYRSAVSPGRARAGTAANAGEASAPAMIAVNQNMAMPFEPKLMALPIKG